MIGGPRNELLTRSDHEENTGSKIATQIVIAKSETDLC